MFTSTLATGLALMMVLSLVRLIQGPTLWDRLSALGLVGTKTVVLLLLFGQLSGKKELDIDITLAYTLLTFVGALALARYFEEKANSSK